MANCIEVKNLSFSYTKDPVLTTLDFTMEQGEMVAIVGENGSGKSTLLKVLIGQLKNYSGSAKVLGQEVARTAALRQVSYIPQNISVQSIAFPITCLEMVVLNLHRDFGPFKIPSKKAKKKASELLHDMGLGEYLNTPFKELSGGLQQRVMICRALVNEPQVIIMDEPTAGIDEKSKGIFLELIAKLQEDYQVSIVLVTHELDLLHDHLKKCRILKMKNGGLENVCL
ncbi:MAG: metal ABC transporter ATP-binding protein [Eubacteriales bacterium]|nr:metal ABC transporter ATP-binding protein [Eubacteriales bacterium]